MRFGLGVKETQVAQHPGNSVESDVESLQGNIPGDAYELDLTTEQSRITPIEVTWILWSYRRRIARACLIGLILFTVIAFLVPKKYTATTSLMPPDYNKGSGLMSLAMLAGDGGGGGAASGSGSSLVGLASQLLGIGSSGDVFIGVLRSRTVEDSIIDQFGLMDLYSTRYIEDTRKELESYTDIDVDKKTGIISVSVEDKDPKRAAAMAQAYVERLNRVLADVNTSSAHRERLFVETRLKQVKQELDDSAKEFSIFASQNTAINIPDQAKAMVEAAAELQAELMAAQSQMKALQQVYTDNAVQVKAAKAQIQELQAQLEKFGGKDVNVSGDGSLAKGELYPSIRQLPLLGVKYLDLYRKTKIDEAVYELLTKQYEVVKIQEAREIPTAQILDTAVVPSKKSSPHRWQIMLAGFLLSFLFVSTRLIFPLAWSEMDPKDPRRVLAETVFESAKTNIWDAHAVRKVRKVFSRSQNRLKVSDQTGVEDE
jgi:capsule polysaccharide export protein KpsE/RkpR